MNSRIVPNLPFKDYLASPSYSSSELRLMLETPRLLWAKRHELSAEDPNASHFLQGRALHSLCLEQKVDWVVTPETYPSEGKQKPWHGGAGYCKDWKARQTKDVLSASQHEEVLAWSDAVKKDEQASQFLNVPGRSELSIFANDPETGLPLRIRIDWCPTNGSALFDVKTCQSPDPRGFLKAIQDRLYYVQASFYLFVYNLAAAEHGLPPKNEWCYIAVGKQEPYLVKCYRHNQTDLELGCQLVRKALHRIKACQSNPKKWKLAYPGQTSTEVQTLSLPEWILRNTDARDDNWISEDWK